MLLTKAPAVASNQKAASALWPLARMAARAFCEMPKSFARPPVAATVRLRRFSYRT